MPAHTQFFGIKGFGFTKENELFVGRVAQLGFAAALIGEAVTGVGPLAQLGECLLREEQRCHAHMQLLRAGAVYDYPLSVGQCRGCAVDSSALCRCARHAADGLLATGRHTAL